MYTEGATAHIFVFLFNVLLWSQLSEGATALVSEGCDCPCLSLLSVVLCSTF